MKFSVIIFIYFCINSSFSQSLQDIQKLKDIQKQIEKTAEQKQTGVETTPVKSLETFEDSLSQIPIQRLEAVKIKQEEKDKEKDTDHIELNIDDEFAKLKPFGYDIFYNSKLDLKPSLFGPVSGDYPLGPGDETIITLWGEVEIRHSIILDRNGQIMFPDVGLINLAGLTINETRKKLFNILKNYYSGLKTNKITLEVSLGKLHSIRVYVTGEVNQPGVFTVPAYISPYAMLFYTAGVKLSGSLRSIFVMRQGKKIADLDFYSLLLGIETTENIHLQNDDIIVIPPVKNQVFLAGAINLPGIYEFKSGESLRQLLNFAGGWKPNANLEQIEIRRYLQQEEPILVNVDYQKLKENNENFNLMSDDKVFVYEIERERKNFVTIDGPIFGPKTFTYTDGLTLKQLFSKVDSVRADAYLERILITREYEDQRKEIFSVNLKSIMEGSSDDFILAPSDIVEFKSQNVLFPIDSVSIYGAVNLPGKYVLSKNLTLKDLIYMAGGFAINAKIDMAEVSRIGQSFKSDQVLSEIIKVSLDSTYMKNDISEDENFFLQPYDNVFIFIDSDWELQRNVTITGEVRRPGTYSLESKEDKLSNLIQRAGGLKQTAYIDGAQFYRQADEAGQIGINFIEALEDPESQENIILEDGDEIVIPQRKYTVKVLGGVNFPSSIVYDESMDLDDYISAAGGLVELADGDNISIMLANGKRIREKSFLFIPYLPEEILPGSTIYVPTLAATDKTDWPGAIRDGAAILSSIATVILIMNQVNK